VARLLLAAAALVATGAGCGHASIAATSTTTSSTAATSTAAAGAPASAAPAASARAASGPAAAAAGDSRAFCALARVKGAADLLNLRDSSAQGGGLDKVLANLDQLTAAAPAVIKGDYTRLDRLEHALLGGQPDPQQLARLESPDTVASLQRIQRYLAVHCRIG
jgi:hypothetical protein